MIAFRFLPCVAVLLIFAVWLPGQQFDPPAVKKIDEATRKTIAAKLEKLEKALVEPRRTVLALPKEDRYKQELRLADVEVYLKAATWIVRHGEFYDKDSVAWTVETLDRGLERAELLKNGKSPWIGQPGRTEILGYRSRVDGSFQPFAVTWPSDYGKDRTKKYRVDVVLHGRDSSLTEVKFIHQHHDKPAPKDLDYLRIDIYGRGNVAYRWAGEMDIEEARIRFDVACAVHKPHPVVRKSPLLRGFSMGGAGTWHMGLHQPDQWCVIGPGAGFTTTHGYVKGLPEKLPDYQEKCLHIYDAVDYAENAFHVPVVAYSGEKDPQKAAADNIEKRLRELKIPMTHLVAPGLAHQFPREWQKKAEAEYARYAAEERTVDPRHVRFATYTLRYPSYAWLTIQGLNRHYERALVDAEKTAKGLTVRTENVRVLELKLSEFHGPEPKARIVHMDGQEVEVLPGKRIGGSSDHGKDYVYLERRDGRWRAIPTEQLAASYARHPQKLPGLQGPIDDAFMDSFLCVRGTGKPWHEATQNYAMANLNRFSDEWNKFLRGDLPIKDDKDVTEADIQDKSLILFGDPASNSLIGKVLDKLPLKWSRESITFADKTVSADEHVPLLIYPNPLNPKHYVVLNSGHTFHAADFRGTNALLFPRLGDYALLKLAPTPKDPLSMAVIEAGLFDDFWRMK